jgi:hypothetical protein
MDAQNLRRKPQVLRRLGIIALLSMLVVALTAVPALTQNPHFVGQVRFTDLGTTLQATGSVAGLGNQNIDVILTATGTASIDCRNPGGNIAPGQSKAVTVTGSRTNVEVKNGRANFTVVTEEPVAPADACPNPQWTPIVRDVEFTSATITVIQPSGSDNVVLESSFSL